VQKTIRMIADPKNVAVAVFTSTKLSEHYGFSELSSLTLYCQKVTCSLTATAAAEQNLLTKYVHHPCWVKGDWPRSLSLFITIESPT